MVSAACCGPIEAQTISVALACFLEPDRFLDRDLVERIHRHFDVAELDAGAVCLDADFHVLVDRPLHGHENFHGA